MLKLCYPGHWDVETLASLVQEPAIFADYLCDDHPHLRLPINEQLTDLLMMYARDKTSCPRDGLGELHPPNHNQLFPAEFTEASLAAYLERLGDVRHHKISGFGLEKHYFDPIWWVGVQRIHAHHFGKEEIAYPQRFNSELEAKIGLKRRVLKLFEEVSICLSCELSDRVAIDMGVTSVNPLYCGNIRDFLEGNGFQLWETIQRQHIPEHRSTRFSQYLKAEQFLPLMIHLTRQIAERYCSQEDVAHTLSAGGIPMWFRSEDIEHAIRQASETINQHYPASVGERSATAHWAAFLVLERVGMEPNPLRAVMENLREQMSRRELERVWNQLSWTHFREQPLPQLRLPSSFIQGRADITFGGQHLGQSSLPPEIDPK